MPEGSRRVLVIDDEALLHPIYTRAAHLGGAEAVDVALTASQAMDLLEEHHYRCILLDKNLPDLGGVALAEIIRHADPAARIVVVTGYPSLESAADAMRLGCFDYLAKPFQMSRLIARVQAALTG